MTETEATRPELTGKCHSACLLLPMMSEEELRELQRDLRANGQRHPIVVDPAGVILDGRHRYLAMIHNGAVEELKVEVFSGTEEQKVALVMSENIHQRHLTTQQRAAIAAELATMRKGTRTDLASSDALSDAQAARVMGVSEPTVERAKRRMREDPEAHAKAKAGTLPKRRGIKRPKPIDGDRAPCEPKRNLLTDMGRVVSWTPTEATRYLAEYPDDAKKIADIAGSVAKIAEAVGKPKRATVPTQNPATHLIDEALTILDGMRKVADAADQGDQDALRTIIAGAKRITELGVRIVRAAQEFSTAEPFTGAAQRISPRTGKPVRKYTKRAAEAP